MTVSNRGQVTGSEAESAGTRHCSQYGPHISRQTTENLTPFDASITILALPGGEMGKTAVYEILNTRPSTKFPCCSFTYSFSWKDLPLVSVIKRTPTKMASELQHAKIVCSKIWSRREMFNSKFLHVCKERLI